MKRFDVCRVILCNSVRHRRTKSKRRLQVTSNVALSIHKGPNIYHRIVTQWATMFNVNGLQRALLVSLLCPLWVTFPNPKSHNERRHFLSTAAASVLGIEVKVKIAFPNCQKNVSLRPRENHNPIRSSQIKSRGWTCRTHTSAGSQLGCTRTFQHRQHFLMRVQRILARKFPVSLSISICSHPKN